MAALLSGGALIAAIMLPLVATLPLQPPRLRGPALHSLQKAVRDVQVAVLIASYVGFGGLVAAQ